MKGITVTLSLMMLVVLTGSLFAEGSYLFDASVHVYNHTGAPQAGMPVKLWLTVIDPQDRAHNYEYIRNTDSGGYVWLYCLVPPENYEFLEWMAVTIQNPDYSIISSQNTQTQSGFHLDPVFNIVYDRDGDLLYDILEQQLAEKFSPVLHKHSYDLQQNLENFDRLLEAGAFTLTVYNDIGQTLYSGQISGGPDALHKWNGFNWDTYGWGSASHGVYRLDLANSKRYEGAPIGQRPIYYHVYKNAGYYYVQYWYYFGANDIREQVGGLGENWHESDWEHVSIRVIKQPNGTYQPDKIDFQIHNGGRTISAADCWWSPTTAPSYQNVNQGYVENSRTHLHIWISANAHSSNNRYDKVYKVNTPVSTYQDRVDYSPNSYNLYFQYDQLIQLGEVTKKAMVKCPNSGYSLEYHVYPIKTGGRHWLAYIGLTGEFQDVIIWDVVSSPRMPAYEENHHEWVTFSIGSPVYGNGSMWVSWVVDNNVGD